MAEIGIDAAHVEHVIITHFHYDHTGNHALFPRAIFYVQDAEMRFYTGRHARHPSFAASIEVEDIAALIGLNCEGRLLFVDGEREILPGITVHHVGGHTAGMPVVSVHDLPGVHHAFQRIRDLAGAPGLTIPGHDPLVLTRLVTVAPGIVRATA